MVFSLKMLIEICEDVVTLAERSDSDSIAVLEKLAMAHRYGKHFVYASFPLLNKICRMESLNKPTRKIYSDIKKHCASSGTLVSGIGFRVKVTIASPPASASVTYIQFNPKLMSGFELYEETHLLAENLLDCSFFKYIVEYYKRSMGISCPVCFYPMQGGGDTIKMVYLNEIQLGQHFCLAIMDSDKKHSQDALGNTCKGVKKVHKKHNPFHCFYYIMENIREVENLIPLSIVKLYSNYSNKQIFRDNINAEFSFFDMKEGLLSCKITENIYTYWTSQLFGYTELKQQLSECSGCVSHSNPKPKESDCEEVCDRRCIIEGFGSKLLDNLYKDNTSKERLKNVEEKQLSSAQKNEWYTIGKLIFEWCCASSHMRS